MSPSTVIIQVHSAVRRVGSVTVEIHIQPGLNDPRYKPMCTCFFGVEFPFITVSQLHFGVVSKLFRDVIQLAYWDRVFVALKSDSFHTGTFVLINVEGRLLCIALQSMIRGSTLEVFWKTDAFWVKSEIFRHQSEQFTQFQTNVENGTAIPG